jgi:hypothetical protein
MIEFIGLAVAAYWAAAWRRASRPLPHISNRLLRDIGLTRACAADGHRTRTSIVHFGPFGLPIGF